MFEALPVVIPTLRDVARGTLRPAEPAGDAEATADAPTAAILLDARTPGMPTLGALYDELELYLQAANIASLRLHRRGERTVTQMFDILAGVTLLRSHGCRRVILVVAAEGTLPSWEHARAETLASLLDFVRRQHSGTARELIGAIADLVETIRVVADSVTGVATILVPPTTPVGSHRSRAAPATWRSPAAGREESPQPAAGLPKALVLPLREGDDHVRAVSQLYVWCRSLARATLAAPHEAGQVSDEALPRESAPHSTALTELRAAGTDFHAALRWLDDQWSELVAEMERRTPHSAVRILATEAAHLQAIAQQSRSYAGQVHSRIASRAAWRYLDTSTRLRWLDLCRQAFAALGTSMATQEQLPAPIEHVD